MDELVDLTVELVSIPSHEDETAAGDAIEAWLRDETDATATRDDAGNVIARKGATGNPDATSLALVGHHDVVPPADRQLDADGGYVVEQRDGRIYGRGTADMKGSVAACMLAFRDADLAGATTPTGGPLELVFASFVGEETGGVGARAAIDDGFRPDYAVVAEGSTNYSKSGVTDVVVAHKGRRGSTIVASGDAAHASEPEAGENAIYRMCDAVDAVRDLEFPETEVAGMQLQGSVAVTEIGGGTAGNVIPDRCEATVDERTVPGQRADLERVEEVPGVEWRVDSDLPPMQCGSESFADAALGAARASQDGEPELTTKPHATDAGRLAEEGTHCLVCGASEPGEAHTETESASVEVLARCYRIYKNLAESGVGE